MLLSHEHVSQAATKQLVGEFLQKIRVPLLGVSKLRMVVVFRVDAGNPRLGKVCLIMVIANTSVPT